MFKSFFKQQRSRTQMPPIAPRQNLRIIGDIHGRADLMDKALNAASNAQTILVGDYVDRGENSAAVLRHLCDRADLICLMGNHEDMLLRFLDDPTQHGARWLRYGGLQTLASFGVAGASETSSTKSLEIARDQLETAMGVELLQWLRSLPSVWQSGNVGVVHAGADPATALQDQDLQTLRWGHPDFATTDRIDGIWVVHGHTIVEQPLIRGGTINVDTGAYATGRLSQALITQGGVSFETFI
jgi:serine/threonine protein phosphatase 1